MKSKSIVMIFFIVLLLIGCTSFRYGNKTFSDADSALNEQQKNLVSILNKINPEKFTSCKQALFIIPDYAAISEKSIRKSRLSTPEIVDYVTKTTYNDLNFMINSVNKYNLFEKIGKIESGSPQNTAKMKSDKYDIIIYYKVNNPNDQGWELVISKNSGDIKKLAIDTKVPAGVQRTKKWLANLQHEVENICK